RRSPRKARCSWTCWSRIRKSTKAFRASRAFRHWTRSPKKRRFWLLMAARSSSGESLFPPRTSLPRRCRCSGGSRSSGIFSNGTTSPLIRRSCCSSLRRGLSPDNTRPLGRVTLFIGMIRGDSGLLKLFYEHTILAEAAGITAPNCRRAAFRRAFHESRELVLPDGVHGRGGGTAGVEQRIPARDRRPLYFASEGRNLRLAGCSAGRITDGHDGEALAGA